MKMYALRLFTTAAGMSLFHYNVMSQNPKVIPKLRGVGLTKVNKEIHIDRYSKVSDKGVSISFIDTLDRFKGWKTIFDADSAWVQHNSVDFGQKPLKIVSVKALSGTGGTVQIHTNSINGPLIAEIKIPKGSEWKVIKTPVKNLKPAFKTYSSCRRILSILKWIG